MSHITHTNEPYHTYKCVVSHIQMSHVTHTNESCHTYKCVVSHVLLVRHTQKTFKVEGYTDHVFYRVVTISKLLKITGLFCRRAL